MRLESAAGAIASLLPKPRQARLTGVSLALAPSAWISVTPADSPEAISAARRLADLVEQEHGVRLAVQPEDGEAFRLCLGRGMSPAAQADMAVWGDESYRLQVTQDEASVQATTARGLLWGAMTLRQLVSSSAGQLSLPGVEIVDWPRYPWRGFMIDSGRSPNSLAQIKRIVRICSVFKLNFVVLRVDDDELNAVRYQTNQLGSLNPLALDMDQVAELIEYAHGYGIDVVPEIESLGHSTAKGFLYPHLVDGGFQQPYGDDFFHIRKSHLNPEDPRTYELLGSMYDEWFAIMRCPLIHLGLDEVRMDAEGQAAHMARLLPLVDRIAARHDLQVMPMVYADAPPTPPDYADRVVRCIWSYANRAVSLENEHLIRQGLDRLSEPGVGEQVIMAGGSGSRHEPYTKSEDAAAIANLADWARWGAGHDNFIGLLAVQWHGNMLDDWLPDFLAAADYAWQPPDGPVNAEAELARAKAHLARVLDAASPDPDEVDRHAWDGIWLRDGTWYEDIMSGRRFGPE